MSYTCCDENRRDAVDAHPTLNGIDWLEVLDLDAPEPTLRQRTLLLRLLKPVPAGLSVTNIRIDGGERIRDVTAEWIDAADGALPEATAAERAYLNALDGAERILVIRTDSTGDFSTYTLQLVQGPGSDAPLPDFDPRLSRIDFSFKVECPSDLDCAPVVDCPEDPHPEPEISYLARDYESIRQLLLDRLSTQMPGWQGKRSPADVVHTLAELIAYVGDQQHYELDAITTEAYLRTARQRSSLRRHALLVDYRMHEGCNARTWLHVEVSGAAVVPVPSDLRLFTRTEGVPDNATPASPDERALRQAGAVVFEPMHGGDLRRDHNDFDFHTWGDDRCCLPTGATHATLVGHWPELAAGDVLVFREEMGPLTGEAADADPTHRQAVRLVEVRAFDGGVPLIDPLTNEEITEITWHAQDALTFPLCISSETDAAHGSVLINDVSIALGNIVLVDHGDSVDGEELGQVPDPILQFPPVAADPCDRDPPEPLPPRFRPVIGEAPVTRQGTVLREFVEDGLIRRERVPFDPTAAASAALEWRVGDAVPDMLLASQLGAAAPENWTPVRDLLNSRANDRHFVLEARNDATGMVRLGDDDHGRRPDAGEQFSANYRVGNGPEGNIGADSLAHALTTEGRIVRVTNPLPGQGGQAPESMAQVRRRAPQAFRRQERAVTPEDYAEVTERLPGVQRAAATLRWTGSWHTVFVTVDRVGGLPVDDAYAAEVVAHLDRYRMAGRDVRVNDPVYVSLELDLLVCVDPSYFAADVRRGLAEVLGAGRRRDGQLAIFHPDNFSFGQTVHLSPIYAAAREVAGVASVQATLFHRMGQYDPAPLADGKLLLDRLEIARLSNDPSFPEHGVLRLNLVGGK